MDKSEYLELYHQMVLIRRVEERAAELYQQGKIGGFLHLYIGQEAVSTGLISARKPQDRVITAYRDHGVAINVGISPRELMAELLGKATGISKGKGGSMHMADVKKNYWGGHAVVGEVIARTFKRGVEMKAPVVVATANELERERQGSPPAAAVVSAHAAPPILGIVEAARQ